MPDDDGRLAALIDNELDQEEQGRACSQGSRRARPCVSALRGSTGRARLVTAFDALLEQEQMASRNFGPPFPKRTPTPPNGGGTRLDRLARACRRNRRWPSPGLERPPGSGSAITRRGAGDVTEQQ